jgi:hypothetical protein
MDEGLRHYTERHKTPRLQRISPALLSEELDLEGEITITPREARAGTRKLISVPQGLRKRPIRVTIPPGVGEGTRLRLSGLGRSDDEGNRGDLFLVVRLEGN